MAVGIACGVLLMLRDLTDAERRIRDAEAYLAARTGCYEYRCERYDAALTAMHGLGLDDDCTVVDVGAGAHEFGCRLHTGRDRAQEPPGVYLPPSRARYYPVDAALDGVDLEHWTPRKADWFVALEIVEHLRAPARLLTEMAIKARRGVVVSTPNPQTTDVLGMDPTHQTAVTRSMLELAGYRVETASFYGREDDSLFAVASSLFV